MDKQLKVSTNITNQGWGTSSIYISSKN